MKNGAHRDRAPLERKRRCYADLIRDLGARVEAWHPGRVVLAAVEAEQAGRIQALLCELAMVLVYASVLGDDPPEGDIEMRVAVITVRSRWRGPLRASAWTLPCRTALLLESEVRADGGVLVARAFACVGPAPNSAPEP